MKFRLIIDRNKEEEVVATVHDSSVLTDQLEQLVLQYVPAGHGQWMGYSNAVTENMFPEDVLRKSEGGLGSDEKICT